MVAVLVIASVTAGNVWAVEIARTALMEGGDLCTGVRSMAAPPAPTMAQPSDPAKPAASFETLLLVQPLTALRLACTRLAPRQTTAIDAGGADTLKALLDVAEAAIGAGRLDPAARVLEALQRTLLQPGSDSGVDPDSRARFHLLRAAHANERSEIQREAAESTLARATLEAAGLTRTERFATVLVAQASAWRHLRAHDGLQKAADALEQAAALLRALGLDVSIAMIGVLNERTVLANARQDVTGAVVAAREEIAMYRQLGHGDSSALLNVLASLGGLLSTLGRAEESELALQDGLRLIDLHPQENVAAALGVLNNLATTYSDTGRLPQALATADRAVQFAERTFGSDSVRSVRPLTVRAGTLRRLARYAESRTSLEQALRIATLHPDDVGALRRMNLYETLAATLIQLGETADAQTLIERGLQETADTPTLGYWHGRLMVRTGIVASRKGDWAAADAALLQGMALIAPVVGERNVYVLGMWSPRCFAQTMGSLPGNACEEVEAALPVLDGADPGYRFRAHAVLAHRDERHGSLDEALLHHLRAVAAAESAATPDPLWSAYGALAEHLRGRGMKSLAVLLGKQAIEQIERMRGLLGADAQRSERSFLADKQVVYRRLADWLTEDGRVDEALDVLRLLKEEEFLDFVNRDGSLLGVTSGGPAYSDGEGAQRRAWRSQGGVGEPPPAGAPQDPSIASRREAEFVARWRELLDQHRRGVDAAAAPGRSASGAPPERRVVPSEGELWVWLYPGERRLNLVIDAPQRRIVGTLDATPADMASAVLRLLSAIERREPVQAQLQSLHALIGAPVERAAAAAGGTRRIVFMVDGPLRYLPFAALTDGRSHLGDRYSIEQRVPVPLDASPTSLPRIGGTRVWAMGVTQPKLAGMPRLGQVAGEICGIVAGPVTGLAAGDDDAACGADGTARGAVEGSGWVNEAFTAERLEDAVARARQAPPGQVRLLHIGTHFVLRPGRMTRSWLLLGDGRQLSLEALGRLDFSGQALVTLSACETGIGGATAEGGSADASRSGDEIDGLGGLMLRRGAGAVVASLWRVADSSTRVLMQHFYRQLARGATPAEALQLAQSQVRLSGGRMAHPFHWAGFHLVTGMH